MSTRWDVYIGGKNKDGSTRNPWIPNGDWIAAANQAYFAFAQGDGNFVIYRGSHPGDPYKVPLWQTGKLGQGDYFILFMQGDGNLVWYQGAEPSTPGKISLWASDTQKSGPPKDYVLYMQNDGNLCIYQTDSVSPEEPYSKYQPGLWCSGTSNVAPPNLEFHFRNFTDRQVKFRVNHPGCGSSPDIDNRLNCWEKTIPHNPTGGHDSVYNPSAIAIDPLKWVSAALDEVKEGLMLAYSFLRGDLLDYPVGTAMALAGILNTEMEVVKTLITKDPEMVTKLKTGLSQMCNEIGVEEQTILNLAERMALPPHFGFVAGNRYATAISNSPPRLFPGQTGGWTITAFDPPNASLGSRIYANHAFLVNGRLILAYDDNTRAQLWRD